MSLSAGTMLGPYRIARLIGAGGMGEVYEAVDTRLDRAVAIKVLPEHVAADPDRRKRFAAAAKVRNHEPDAGYLHLMNLEMNFLADPLIGTPPFADVLARLRGD